MVGGYIVVDSPQSQYSQTVFAAAARAGAQVIVVDSYCDSYGTTATTFDYRRLEDVAVMEQYFDVMRERRESNSRNWKAIQRGHNFHQSKWTHNRPKHG